MRFGDDEAPGPAEGAPAIATDRATIDHPRPPAARRSPPRTPHPPAYRGVVAGWPEDWRERWGRRANELEEGGLSWRDAEAQAFVEVWHLVRRDRPAGSPPPAGSDPERN
jgi:hypothetical protein